VGTSSVRGALYDGRALRLEETAAHESHPLIAGPDGAVEAPADELAACVERVVDAVLAAAGGDARKVAAVGLDTLASTLLGADASGRAVTPLYTYADTRPADDVRELRRELDGEAVLQRTGCPLHAAYWPARLRWLRRTRAADAARVASWMDLGTFLLRRWLGRADVPMSYSIASWTGLLDRRALGWDAPLLESVGIPAQALPALADHTAGQRGLAGAFARRWPALSQALFFPAVGDGAAANVGSGCVSPARIALTVGTTGRAARRPARRHARGPAGPLGLQGRRRRDAAGRVAQRGRQRLRLGARDAAPASGAGAGGRAARPAAGRPRAHRAAPARPASAARAGRLRPRAPWPG
jgi:gluconokinase